ncbi:unnamed protein product [Lactuca virosa]|uniref:Myb/SANT-like domain-containing protein n=1 Tax=Lactuca virosa TaxID=75947 RepID=A0AAU9PTV6_9ASTR|nr:unnamed protein product [Lactuca virosa]
MAGRNKHTWTTEEDAKLIEALLELHVSGKYGGAENGFKPGYLKAVQQLLDVSLPNSGLKAEPHIKSRMKTWKNHFNIVHDMVYGTNTSGFGWDTDKCCVTADAEVWNEYIKSHKGVACFHDKPFPQFDNLCKIFGKDRATGHGATDLGEDATEETQRNSPIDVEGLEDIVEETQQIARGNNKRKKPPTDDTESSYKDAAKEMKETFKEVGEKLNETIYNIGRQENKEACDMIDKVIEDIQRMPNINVKQRIKAIDMFSKDQFRARAFFKMTEEEKICYMEMIGDGSIS